MPGKVVPRCSQLRMKFLQEKTIDVVGLVNALMDILVEVDDNFLTSVELEKGRMHLVDGEKVQKLLFGLTAAKLKSAPGGTVAHTIKGVAALGGEAVLFSKDGHDEHGDAYMEAIHIPGDRTIVWNHLHGTCPALQL